MNKVAIQLTTSWLNVTATFTNGKSYSLQNKGPNDVLLYEGTSASDRDAFVIQRNGGAGTLTSDGTTVWMKSVNGVSSVAVSEH